MYYLVNSHWYPLAISNFLISSFIPFYAVASNKYVCDVVLRCELSMIDKNGQGSRDGRDRVFNNQCSTVTCIVDLGFSTWLIFVLPLLHGPPTTFHLPFVHCHPHLAFSSPSLLLTSPVKGRTWTTREDRQTKQRRSVSLLFPLVADTFRFNFTAVALTANLL